MKGVGGRAHRGTASWGLEFPELLPVLGCFGKLTRLALASEAALGWWTNTESSELLHPWPAFPLPQPWLIPGRADGCRSSLGLFWEGTTLG